MSQAGYRNSAQVAELIVAEEHFFVVVAGLVHIVEARLGDKR